MNPYLLAAVTLTPFVTLASVMFAAWLNPFDIDFTPTPKAPQ